MPDHKFMVTANGSLFFSSAASYRQIYGQAVFMPEIKITRLVYRNISVWGGFGWIAKKGLIEEVNEPAQIRQTMLSIGAGSVYRLNGKLQLRAEAGLTFNSFKEEALEETLKGSGLGWKIGANLDYFVWKKVFATLSASFSQAGDEVETGKVKLGGFLLGVGLGFAF
ncbi:MAG: outer membrane beta-barrel protein [Candidatus Aminicenantes bacterium]|nr:outer membrane beta-barrel protein [Candidatus Aminicenantes bacterium]